MTSQLEREIKTLREIADNYPNEWYKKIKPEHTYDTPHDAESITNLVETSCLAVREPSSPRIQYFVSRCALFSTYDLNAIGFSKLELILSEVFWRLDELFFFGMLTRRVYSRIDHWMQNLVVLKVLRKHNPKFRGAFSGEGTIKLVPNADGWPYFEELLFVIVHEMTHAWLEIFSDIKHPKHEELVSKNFGHGAKFIELICFIAPYIAYLKSNSSQGMLGPLTTYC
ncbi:hypothetical protein F5Y12DRAFT_716697 [Xylaria sp. FL1777]|nr:hypothetical protein F5Y12DRAFT_716697 [Xylaria sp. FL1777]